MYRFRFFIMYLKCIFSKKKKLLDHFYMNFTAVPLFDTDVSRMFTQTYFSYMALARWQFMLGSEFGSVARKNKWAPITSAETIMYKKSIKTFDPVVVQTKLICWTDDKFYLQQIFWVRKQMHAIGYLEGLVRGAEGAMKPPTVFKEAGVEEFSPPMPEYIKSWIAAKAQAPQVM
jgi:acyl-CoA thioesterase FadM